MQGQEDLFRSQQGEFESPGGFVFGVQGWSWGSPQPRAITFFLDGTAKVSDQHGRPIRGTSVDNKEVLFAITPPVHDEAPTVRAKLATHAQVIAALHKERVDWRTLSCAGFPQLPYEELKKLGDALPPTPLEELRKIKDADLRKAAIRARREADEVRDREMAAIQEE
jgi:hypothetical protein